ncbi:MAG TPA: class I SAM-dependent methyltransferase [Planctomycetota bacterium]|nr:class I SAM-dependent methyltransferase [Planctomycetota bacterium]
MVRSAPEPWLHEAFALTGVPAMVSRSEQKYLYWLTRTQWRDVGHVVEIGPWLGGSTLCLARGMEASRQRSHRLHAFDNFIWRDFMARFEPLPIAAGDSFEPFFLRNVSAVRDYIVARSLTLPDEKIPGDAQAEEVRGSEAPAAVEFSWDATEPIEILFVDGAKSWRGMRWLLKCVAPALIPGQTLFVCQDFKHWGSSWVPLMIARIEKQLELIHVVQRGSTATFRLREALDGAVIEALADDVTKLDTESALADLERMAIWIATKGDDVGAAHVRLGAVQLLCHHGRPEEALARFEQIQSRWPLRGAKGQLHDARRYLEARGSSPTPYRAWRNLLQRIGLGAGRERAIVRGTR